MTLPGVVAVFWDYENVRLPISYSAAKAAGLIRDAALQGSGKLISMKAYMSVDLEASRDRLLHRSSLQSSGVSIVDTPHHHAKEIADKMIIVDIMLFAMDNPPLPNSSTTTILLITGDRDFAYVLAVLRMRQYRVILISLDNANDALTQQCDALLLFRDVLQIDGRDAHDTRRIERNQYTQSQPLLQNGLARAMRPAVAVHAAPPLTRAAAVSTQINAVASTSSARHSLPDRPHPPPPPPAAAFTVHHPFPCNTSAPNLQTFASTSSSTTIAAPSSFWRPYLSPARHFAAVPDPAPAAAPVPTRPKRMMIPSRRWSDSFAGLPNAASTSTSTSKGRSTAVGGRRTPPTPPPPSASASTSTPVVLRSGLILGGHAATPSSSAAAKSASSAKKKKAKLASKAARTARKESKVASKRARVMQLAQEAIEHEQRKGEGGELIVLSSEEEEEGEGDELEEEERERTVSVQTHSSAMIVDENAVSLSMSALISIPSTATSASTLLLAANSPTASLLDPSPSLSTQDASTFLPSSSSSSPMPKPTTTLSTPMRASLFATPSAGRSSLLGSTLKAKASILFGRAGVVPWTAFPSLLTFAGSSAAIEQGLGATPFLGSDASEDMDLDLDGEPLTVEEGKSIVGGTSADRAEEGEMEMIVISDDSMTSGDEVDDHADSRKGPSHEKEAEEEDRADEDGEEGVDGVAVSAQSVSVFRRETKATTITTPRNTAASKKRRRPESLIKDWAERYIKPRSK